MLGKYLEASMASFADFQSQLQEQSHVLHGENSRQMQSDMWSQFMTFQVPAMRTMMAAYMEQTRKMAHQMQDQLKNQTQNMFPGAAKPATPAGPADAADTPDSFDH
jgi:polyhydroxyalkanoate synthesis regulator protein